MKRTTVISLVAAITFLGASIVYAQAGRPTIGAIGSFQLLAGHYAIVGDGAAAEQSAVFRIDTRTGKAWDFMNGKDSKSGRLFTGRSISQRRTTFKMIYHRKLQSTQH